MLVAIGSKVVRNLLSILFVERENTKSCEEALSHLKDVQIVPTVETAEQNLADLIEEGSLYSERLCLVSLALTCLREEREEAVALRCVVGLLAKFLQLLLLELLVLRDVVFDLQAVLEDDLEALDDLDDVVVLRDDELLSLLGARRC